MPVQTSYPGVYIEEVPSTVRTIVGVPTSVTAFVGPALRGRVGEPVPITSWADFVRAFGGLSDTSMMSYAVLHYYQNGGSEARIVRVAGANAAPAALALQDGPALEASSAGAWGNNLVATVDSNTRDALPGEDKAKIYNLTIRDAVTGDQETFRNVVAVAASPSALDKVLATARLVRLKQGEDVSKRPKDQVDTKATADSGKNGDALTADGIAPNAGTGGIYALRNTDFNILCLPPLQGDDDLPDGVASKAVALCVEKRAMLLLDPPKAWIDITEAVKGAGGGAGGVTPAVSGDDAKNAALYFPRLRLPDRNGLVRTFPPCGAVAGVWARTDTQRGVWKAPAGTDASLNGVQELTVRLSDLENGQLNPLGVNCLRTFPIVGSVVWGARTLRGADRLADQWKYVPVRRTALYIEESLYRGTGWVVFEPNDEPLWAAIRLNVGAFMNSLFRQGAFQGRTPQQAYLVKCDADNNPQNDIDRGIVNILVGFAPLKPAEFVLIHIQQLAGQIQV